MRNAPFTIPFLTSPLPWVFLAAIFFGAAVSRVTMRTRGRPRTAGAQSVPGVRDPDRAWTRKWVFACVYLSVAISLGLAAVFLPGPEKILDIRLAYVAGAVAAIAFVTLRFKKSVGIPIVLLLLFVVIFLGLFLQSIRAFTGETEIARVRVISMESDRIKLELISPESGPVLLDLEGEYFAPIVRVVIFDDLFVFLGAKTWYRFEGMTSFKLVKENGGYRFRQGNTDFYFPQPRGITEGLWSLFEKNEKRIPGIKTVQVEMDLKRADTGAPLASGTIAAIGVKEFNSYKIMIQNDGGVEIQPVSN